MKYIRHGADGSADSMVLAETDAPSAAAGEILI